MAWDRYLQPNTGNPMETDQYFPTGFTPRPMADDGLQQPLEQQQQQQTYNNFGYNAYMGNDGAGQ